MNETDKATGTAPNTGTYAEAPARETAPGFRKPKGPGIGDMREPGGPAGSDHEEETMTDRNPFDTLRENPFVVTWNGSLLDAMVAACPPEEFGGTTPDDEDETR